MPREHGQNRRVDQANQEREHYVNKRRRQRDASVEARQLRARSHAKEG